MNPCIAPYPEQNEFFLFSKACFSKHLKWFCSTLLLYTATMLQTSRMPRFLFWNECYRFSQIQILIQVEKWMSELNYHEESTEDKEFVART